jgi:hypothetical protein
VHAACWRVWAVRRIPFRDIYYHAHYHALSSLTTRATHWLHHLCYAFSA